MLAGQFQLFLATHGPPETDRFIKPPTQLKRPKTGILEPVSDEVGLGQKIKDHVGVQIAEKTLLLPSVVGRKLTADDPWAVVLEPQKSDRIK